MTRLNETKWNFEKGSADTEIAAIRVRFVDAREPEMANEMFIVIPKGGRCEYSPSDRMFYIFDADNEVFRHVHAPEEAAVDISYISKEYMDALDGANLGSYRYNVN